MKPFDAIIVGAGAGGGVAASVLSAAGWRVLVLERGRWQTFADEPRDHLRNHRLSTYGNNTGPDREGNPRVFSSEKGDQVVAPHEDAYNLNASAVGSGTLVYGGQAWRFHPKDFRMASHYGVPDGSSLVDWPISYDELAPYYTRAEWEIGVAGGDPAPQMPERSPYPLPPVPRTTRGRRLAEGAAQLGWSTQTPPLLINTVPRDGRAACAACQHCVGFQCPTDAKNGTQNTVIPRALATGNCEIRTGVMVTRIEREGDRVTGVRYVDASGEHTVRSSVVVLSAGAIESARLLLLSDLGNAHDQVGRNLQGHYYAGAWGMTADPTWDGVGPGVSIATLEFNHENDGIVGGGMLADDFIVLPIVHAKRFRPADVPTWGLAHKRWMRDSYSRFLQVTGPVHEIPNPECRVTLDPAVRDRYGLPVARLSGVTHPETVRTATYLQARAVEWLRAAGAADIVSPAQSLRLSAGQHQAGTCRMGDDPHRSVVDRTGRVHGISNLYVADGSVHPTNGGFNPVLTIMAMAYRIAESITERAVE